MLEQPSQPLRLFLDAGIVIDGACNRWGASKGVLILTALRANFRAMIAKPVHDEIMRNMLKRSVVLPDEEAHALMTGLEGWYGIARPLRLPWPSAEQMRVHAGLLAAVRHRNDMPAVIAAVLARPDWVLSTNTAHWNQELARRTGLRVAHPVEFLESLRA